MTTSDATVAAPLGAHCPHGPAFGGLVGTASTYGRLLQALMQPHSLLLTDDTRAWLCEVQPTRRGSRVAMMLGWHVRTAAGEPAFHKEG